MSINQFWACHGTKPQHRWKRDIERLKTLFLKPEKIATLNLNIAKHHLESSSFNGQCIVLKLFSEEWIHQSEKIVFPQRMRMKIQSPVSILKEVSLFSNNSIHAIRTRHHTVQTSGPGPRAGVRVTVEWGWGLTLAGPASTARPAAS
jgi:hypothetical protein